MHSSDLPRDGKGESGAPLLAKFATHRLRKAPSGADEVALDMGNALDEQSCVVAISVVLFSFRVEMM